MGNGIPGGAPYFSGAGQWDSYRTWVRTTAACAKCGKRGMDRARYYGLQDIDGDSWWLTETDCGCTLPDMGRRE
jgi:hypothetical protein